MKTVECEMQTEPLEKKSYILSDCYLPALKKKKHNRISVIYNFECVSITVDFGRCRRQRQ